MKKIVWLFIILCSMLTYGQTTLAKITVTFGDIMKEFEPFALDTKMMNLYNPYASYYINNRETVSPTDGSLKVEVVDLSLPGRDGFDLVLKRVYNSIQVQTEAINKLKDDLEGVSTHAQRYNSFGPGWRLNIPYIASGEIYLPNGNFCRIPSGGWNSDNSECECHECAHFKLKVLKTEECYEMLITPDGIKYLFDQQFRLTTKISANGQNKIQYFYNSKELVKIIDSVGREITFSYKDVGSNRLIDSIQVGQKKISYNYDQNGLLSEVIDASDPNQVRKTKYSNINYGAFKIRHRYKDREGIKKDAVYTYNLCLLENITYPTGAISEYKYITKSQNCSMGDEKYYGDKVLVDSHTIGNQYIKYNYTLNSRYYDMAIQEYWGVLKILSAVPNAYISATEVKEGRKKTQYTFNHMMRTSKAGTTIKYTYTTNPYIGRYYDDGDAYSIAYISPVVASCKVFSDDQLIKQINYDYGSNTKVPQTEPLIEKELRGGAEKYRFTRSYDIWGNLINETDSRNGLEKIITYYAHDNVKNLPEAITVTNKNPVTNGISKVITTYKYNANYLKPEAVTVDPGTQKIVTKYTYYNNGNLKTTINPNGMVETSEYDTTYNAYLSKRTLSGIKDAAGSNVSDIVSRYGYNYYGLKEWEMDGRGYVSQYRYDGLNRLIKVYLPDDPETPFTVPAAGQNPAGNPDREYVFDDVANTCTYWNENRKKTLYSFDGLGRLTSVASYNDQTRYSAVTAATMYHYNDISKIDKVTDPRGNITQYEYDGLGRVSKVIYPTRTSETESSAKLSYDDTANTITVQHENGNVVVHKKDWADQLIQVTQQAVYGNDAVTYNWGFQYDSLGNKVQETNPLENITDYTFDPLSRLEKLQLPSENLVAAGAANKSAIDNPTQKRPTTICTYDVMGNKTSETDANGNKTIYEYDSLGHLILEKKQTTQTNLTTKQAENVTALTKYFYDANGNKVKMIDPNGHIWLYSYSARGYLLSETDPVGNVTRYACDPMGNKIAMIDPRNSKDVPVIWYSFSGNQLVCKDSRSDKSFTTWYLYDDYNRLYRTVMPDKTPPENPFVSTPNYDNPYTETWFGLSGNKISERDPNGIETKYTYSPRNWLETKTGPYSKEEYQYDGVGNQTQAKIWTDISAGTYYTITKDYDSLGRLRRVAYPQSTETYTYDPFNNRLTLKDGNGNLTEYKYNNLGWQVTVTDPLKNTTTYRYDPNGNQVATISPKKLYFINRYDAQNRVMETLDSLGVSTLYNYDCNGNLSGKLDPRSTRWEYVYNENNTLEQLKLTGADKTTYTVSYTYDQAGNRLTVSDTSPIRYAVTYNDLIPDPLNRINVVERQYEGKSYRMVYEYNAGGQVTAVQYPGATTKITYQYNASGQLQEVKGFTKTTGITHYSDGLIKTLTQANNVTTQYTYDTGRRLRELNTSLGANSLLKLTYSFDLAGNITALGDSVSGRQSAYQYQPNNWLKQESTKGQQETKIEDYQYDSDGNRTQRTITLSGSTVGNYSYYPDTDRLLTDGKYGYVYDAAGNLIQKGNKFNVVSNKIEFTAKSGAGVEYWEYGYDLFNRLIKVQQNQQVVAQYGYDPEGLRVVKATSVGTTHYVFDGNEPIFEKQLKSGTIKSYIYASGKHLARVDGVIGDTAAKVYYYHTDHVGSIRKITDSQGKVVWNSDYAAFGNQENKSGSIEELHSFTGKELDPDTGLYYYNARWYDSDLGRFISEDPEADPNSPNLYGYCSNNPLIHTDPTGMVQDDNYWGGLWEDGKSLLSSWGSSWSESTERMWNFTQGYGLKTTNEIGNELTKAGKYDWANWEQELNHNISTEIGNYNFKGKSTSEVSAIKEKIAAQELKEIQGKYSTLYNGTIIPTYKAKLDPLYQNERDSISEAFLTGLNVGIWSAALTTVNTSSNLRFSQTTASSYFSAEGKFSGKTIGEVTNMLRSGKIKPSDVPVTYVERNGVKLIENTRSSLALQRANIPESRWRLVNKTGDSVIEAKITERLQRNGLTNYGTEVLRITGEGKNASSLK